MLPLPHGARTNIESDKSILHTLETAVVDWTHQIQEVIKSNSAAPLEEGLNPGPMIEIDFWAAKAANLSSIYQQLSDEKIQKISVPFFLMVSVSSKQAKAPTTPPLKVSLMKSFLRLKKLIISIYTWNLLNLLLNEWQIPVILVIWHPSFPDYSIHSC